MKAKGILYYPIFLNLKNKKCVVVGGGRVAYRKIKTLLDCGAKVVVISPDFCKDILQLKRNCSIKLIKRPYRIDDIKDASIVIAATDNKYVNRKVSKDSKKIKAIVNVVDSISESDYIVPAFFRRGSLTIAISTGGKSPLLARMIRERLEKDFGKEYELLIHLVGNLRSEIKNEGIRISKKKWEATIDIEKVLDILKERKLKKAKSILLEKLRS
jgi:siroheme synthase-like protein